MPEQEHRRRPPTPKSINTILQNSDFQPCQTGSEQEYDMPTPPLEQIQSRHIFDYFSSSIKTSAGGKCDLSIPPSFPAAGGTTEDAELGTGRIVQHY